MIAILDTALGGIPIIFGSIRMPIRGVWMAFLELDMADVADTPVGPVEIQFTGNEDYPDVTLRGAITSSDAVSEEGRARVIVRAGNGSLQNKALTQRDYVKSPFDVNIALVVQDAILEAGEQPSPNIKTTLESIRVPRWHRASGATATQILDRMAQRFGVTYRFNDAGEVEVALSETFPPIAAELEKDLIKTELDDGYAKVIEVAPPMPSLRPGTTILGKRVQEITYRIGATLRAECSYAPTTSSELAEVVRAAAPNPLYHAVHDVIVRRQNPDGTLDVEGIDSRVGKLSNVPYATGLVGCRLVFAEGAAVRLQWRNGDETLPLVALSEMLALSESWGKAVARVGDGVVCGTLTFTAVAGPGGIASIAVVYQPPTGSPTLTTIVPGAPATLQLAGAIQTGSSEVFIRG